jgi:hypothetical protein
VRAVPGSKNISTITEITLAFPQIFQYLLKYEKA